MLLLLLLTMGSLVALTGLRQFLLQPLATQPSNIIWFLLQIAPILLVLPGAIRLKRTPLFLASLVSTLYFIHGVMLASTEPMRTVGVIEAVIALAACAIATYLVKIVRPAG